MRRSLPLAALLCAGCVAVAQATPTRVPSSASATRAASSSPTARAIHPSPTPTQISCLAQPGRVETGEVLDDDLPRSIPYRVYLPACLDDPDYRPLPVLILLHGLQLTDSQWDELGVDETADSMIRRGEIPPAVIVMPWERKGLEFETAVAEKLLPYVRSTYAGPGDSGRSAIGGISRGAGWALRIGMKHPSEFGAIGLHSPAILVPDLFYLPEWATAAGGEAPELWIDIAERDTSKAGALELASALDELGLDYAWSTAPGEHTAAYWSSRMEDYLRWYASHWSDATAPAAAP